MASPFNLTTYTASEFVKLVLVAISFGDHEVNAIRFEMLRAMFEAAGDQEMADRFAALRDSEQAFVDAATSEQQDCLKLFLEDQGEDVPPGADVVVEKDAAGSPTALSW